MMLPIEQQVISLIQKHERILICLPANPSTDAIASGLAMHSVLQKLGKQSKVVADGFALPENHRFLPKSEEIEHDLTALKKFIISLNIHQVKVQDLTYDIKDDNLNIFVTPKNGFFMPTDVSTSGSDYQFDLIITLDCPEINALGKIFDQNAEFFHHTPIINIDHHAGNEHYGEINSVTITATSISEIIFEFLEHLGKGLLDEYIATNLLTGIISKTKSFKTNSVTPRSLAIASHLIASGARRGEIVQNLYQTKSMQSLKLWGKALAQLEADSDRKIVWSILTKKDFIDTNTNPLDLEPVIDELIVNTPDAETIYIIYEQPDETGQIQVNAIIYTPTYIRALEAFQEWHAHGSENFTYVSVPHSSLQMAQQMIHDKLKILVK